jgi:hypothetical protein
MANVFSPSTHGPSSHSTPTAKRFTSRVALIEVNEPATTLLTECFRQFGMETVPVTGSFAEHLRQTKFDGCVVRLGPVAQEVMEAARNSPANSRMVIYGLGGTAQDAMKYSKFGVNAIFTEPLERQAALKLVRATHLLVLHEFRRYVRVPVVTEVAVTTGEGGRFTATSQDISSGGMSLRTAHDIAPGMTVEVSFALLTLPRIWVRGMVSWRKEKEKTLGVRFDPQDERRLRVKEWIDAHLES